MTPPLPKRNGRAFLSGSIMNRVFVCVQTLASLHIDASSSVSALV